MVGTYEQRLAFFQHPTQRTQKVFLNPGNIDSEDLPIPQGNQALMGTRPSRGPGLQGDQAFRGIRSNDE